MILITGGVGFIGSNLICRLNRADVTDIVISDTLIDARANKTANMRGLKIADRINPDQLMSWLSGRKLDAVVHLGAITDTSDDDAGRMFTTNFCLSVDLFCWCRDNHVPMVYASSAAVYGNGSFGFSEGVSPHSLAPLNVYGWSKLAFDRFVYDRRTRMERPPFCAGLRLFNVYGPNEHHKGTMASMVSRALASGGQIDLFKGDYQRDFVHAHDVCDVIMWALDSRADGIFNVGTGQVRSFEDVAFALECIVNRIDMPADLKPRYQAFTRADIRKLRAGGYDRPFMTLENGIARMTAMEVAA